MVSKKCLWLAYLFNCFSHNLFSTSTQMYSLKATSYPILSFLSQVPGLLGDPSRLLLQKVLGLRAPAPVPVGKGLLGDSPTGEFLFERSSLLATASDVRSQSALQGKTFAMQIFQLFESSIISGERRQALQSVFIFLLCSYTEGVCAKCDIGFHQSNRDFEECVCVQGHFYLNFSAMQMLQVRQLPQQCCVCL